jgi:hypothetical protein
MTKLTLALASALALPCACTSDDGDGGPGTCDLAVTIDTVTCRFFDNPDPFASDSWFVDVTGTSQGGTDTAFSLSAEPQAIDLATQCMEWSQYARFTCLAQAGQPTTASYRSTVEHLHDATPIDYMLTARVEGVFSSSCPAVTVTRAVHCPP